MLHQANSQKWKGRGRGNYRGSSFPRRGNWKIRPAEAVPSNSPLGPTLKSIPVQSLSYSPSEKSPLRIADCELVASFNWMETEEPSVRIPGMPPKWTPPLQPTQLKADSGTYYRDRNAAHYPSHPIEPAVEAIMRMNNIGEEKEPSAKIDIFACGSTLGKLYDFVNGEPKAFRILIDVVGTTVHLIRHERSPKEVIPDVKGYGHTFPEAYTTWDSSVGGSSSHQRVIQYKFAGLKFLVRYEGDGYLPEKDMSSPTLPDINKKIHPKGNVSLDQLTSLMSVTPRVSGDSRATLQMTSGGRPISQDATFDLKTRSITRKSDHYNILSGELHRLWLRQVPNLVLAYHTRGVFEEDEIHIRDVRADLEDWERDNVGKIANFAALLDQVVQEARAFGEGMLEISCEQGADIIHLHKALTDAPVSLSMDVRVRWERWLNGESDDSEFDLHKSGSKERAADTCDDSDDASLDEPSYTYLSLLKDTEPDYTACDKECGYCGRCRY